MAQLDPSIILAGRQADILGAMEQGNALARQTGQLQTENALRQVYSQHGPGIARGEANALNALAAYDPMAAFDISTGIEDRTYRRQRDARADERTAKLDERSDQKWQMELAQYAATLSEKDRLAQSDQITRILAGAKDFHDRGDQPGFDAWLVQNGLDPAQYPFAQFPSLAAQYGEAAKILSGTDVSARVQSSEILDDGTTVMTMSDGMTRVVSPSGDVLEGQAAADAIRTARAFTVDNQREIYGGRREGTLGADIALGGEAQGVKDVATATVKAGAEAWGAYGVIQGSISNINEALEALDRGAQSGIVYNMLPNVTEASASLENAMNRMGLDVIGMVTFGALSEGEMRLAMETAVPRNLSPADLRVWLERKKAAQEKAAAALADAAIYMMTPGNTIGGWIERNRATQQTQQPPVAQPAAAPAQQPAPAQPAAAPSSSDEDLLRKYGIQ